MKPNASAFARSRTARPDGRNEPMPSPHLRPRRGEVNGNRDCAWTHDESNAPVAGADTEATADLHAFRARARGRAPRRWRNQRTAWGAHTRTVRGELSVPTSARPGSAVGTKWEQTYAHEVNEASKLWTESLGDTWIVSYRRLLLRGGPGIRRHRSIHDDARTRLCKLRPTSPQLLSDDTRPARLAAHRIKCFAET